MSEPYDPASLHNVIHHHVIENARVDPRTRRPSSTLLTRGLDPPHFPTKRDLVVLPSSTDPTLRWSWVTKWSVHRHPDVPYDAEGWRFAQRWDVPSSEWVSDASALTPTSRSGLVARRVWVRIAKLYPREQHLIAPTDSSQSEDVDVIGFAVPDSSAGRKAVHSVQQGGDARQVLLHTTTERTDAPDDLGEQSDPLNAPVRTLSQNVRKQVYTESMEPTLIL